MIVKMLKQLRCEWVIIKTRPIMTGWSDASVLEWVMQPRVWCRTTEYRRQQRILSSDWSTLSRDQETPAPGSHLLISSLSSVFSLSLQANSSSTKSCSVSTLFTCVDQWPQNMDFQPPYFPPPFSSSSSSSQHHEVFSHHLQSDHYQHYAVSDQCNDHI